MNELIGLNDKDNVDTALKDLKRGEIICFKLGDKAVEIRGFN